MANFSFVYAVFDRLIFILLLQTVAELIIVVVVAAVVGQDR